MATTEVSFCVRGKTTKQALFIVESDWERPLTEIRTIIQQQDLFVPLEFKFLTLNGNAISEPCEQNLIFKDITHNRGERKDEGIQDLGGKIPDEETKDEKESQPEIWVTALRVIFASSPIGKDGQVQSPSSQTGENEGGSQQQRPASSCPFKSFSESFKREGTTTSVMKVLFGVAIILFAVLASLTLTMHMMVKVFTNMNPSLNDALLKLRSDFGPSDSESSDLGARLSQLEMSHKYEAEQLTSRLAQVEDLYLKDLAIHKRELNILKQRLENEDGRPTKKSDTKDKEEDDDRKEEGAEKYKKKNNPKPKANTEEKIKG